LVGADSNGDIAGYRNIGITGTLTASGSVTADSGYYFGDISKAYIYAQMPDGSAGDEEIVVRTGASPSNKFFKFTPGGNFDLTGGGNISAVGTGRISLASNGDTGFNSPGTGYYSFDTNASTIQLDYKYSSGTGGFGIASNAGETRFTNPQQKDFNWYINGSQRMSLSSTSLTLFSQGGTYPVGGSFFSEADSNSFCAMYMQTSPSGGAGRFSVSDDTGGYSYSFNSLGVASANQWLDVSDSRTKSNIQAMTGALAKINALVGKRFERNGRQEVGFIAQEVEAVIPEAVVTIAEHNGLTDAKALHHGSILSVLVEAVKELSSANAALEARIAALEA
jgi:hypothetical protein